MGFFGKLFEKKVCDVCGEEIGLLGNRKLEDGNLCKECARKLSPWFSERRHSSLEEIKEQLDYREQNRQAVAAFRTTRSFSGNYRVCIDDDAGKFMVVRTNDPETENPDVLDLSQVTGCDLDIQKSRHEEMRTDSEGKRVSYDPPRYWYSYDFYEEIRVEHPYFDDMRFRLNTGSVELRPTGAFFTRSVNPASNREYREYEDLGRDIRAALLQPSHRPSDEEGDGPVRPEPEAPPAQVICPWCGSETTPDAEGCCTHCGGSVSG